MPKRIEGKGYSMTEEEYKRIPRLDDGTYILAISIKYLTEEEYKSIVPCEKGYLFPMEINKITPEIEGEIENKIAMGIGRTNICKEYKFNETEFNKFVLKKFGTKKICDVRKELVSKLSAKVK